MSVPTGQDAIAVDASLPSPPLALPKPPPRPSLIREEWFLGVSIATSLAFYFFSGTLLSGLSHPLWLGVVFAWLFFVILGSALSVVRHADHIAARLGEPFGTLILTLSVTAIEAMSISAVMLHGENNPTLARDTVFAVIMIILNGMVGLSLLSGGLLHREQHYNLQGSNAYLTVIIPLAVLGLVLPNFTRSTAGPTLSLTQETFLGLMSVGLYFAFLAIQTGWHHGYFTLGEEPGEDHMVERAQTGSPHSLLVHALLLGANVIPVVFLAEKLAPPMDYVLETLRAPDAFGGVVIALLVATPEAIGATRAAIANRMQRSVNIFLGSVLSTIGLTIPVMMTVSYFTGHVIVLGVQNGDLVMLLLTLFLSVITLTTGRTNVLQGLVHVLLFLAYLMLIFEG